MIILILSAIVLVLVFIVFMRSGGCGVEKFDNQCQQGYANINGQCQQICRRCVTGECKHGRCYSNTL